MSNSELNDALATLMGWQEVKFGKGASPTYYVAGEDQIVQCNKWDWEPTGSTKESLHQMSLVYEKVKSQFDEVTWYDKFRTVLAWEIREHDEYNRAYPLDFLEVMFYHKDKLARALLEVIK